MRCQVLEAPLGLAVFLFLLLLVFALAIWVANLRGKVGTLKKKYSPILEVERYVNAARAAADQKIGSAMTEAEAIKASAIQELAKAKGKAESVVAEALREKDLLGAVLQELSAQKQQAQADLDLIEEALKLKSDDAHLLEVGYYEPVYGFEDLPRYEAELTKIKEKQKELLKTDGEAGDRQAAAFATESLTYNGSEAQGRQLLKKVLRLMLRAFNGECDSFIARVNYRNVDAMKKRIRSSFDQINKLAETWHCRISDAYLNNRTKELELVFEYEEQKQREKEEQAEIRAQMREEEKAAKEAEREQQRVEKEEAQYQQLLEKAQQEAASASEKDKARLASKIEELQRRLAESEEKKRAISQARITKIGYVYIISNVGSFGDNVYKIGMTRRLEPMDRVKELGDASVPFPFDVHALIRTTDAPALETALHKHFDRRRMNLENLRKEFFRVSIDEIRAELESLRVELGIESELRLTLLAEAKEYRMSEAKRKHLEASWNQ